MLRDLHNTGRTFRTRMGVHALLRGGPSISVTNYPTRSTLRSMMSQKGWTTSRSVTSSSVNCTRPRCRLVGGLRKKSTILCYQSGSLLFARPTYPLKFVLHAYLSPLWGDRLMMSTCEQLERIDRSATCQWARDRWQPCCNAYWYWSVAPSA